MKRIISYIIFFLLTKTILSLDHSVERQAMILNERGVALIESNSEKALQYIRQAHSLVKTAPEYINNLGAVYAYYKKYDQALPYFQKAIKLDPDYPEAYFNQGVCFQELGQNQKAIHFYKKAIIKDSKYWEAYYNLGLVYSHVGNKRMAILYYQKLVRVDPKSKPGLVESAKHNLKELSQ